MSSLISGLQVGGKTLIFLPLIFKEQPNEDKTVFISALVMETPTTSENFFNFRTCN